jgi:exodeoxyribonuclease VII large subunit
VILLTRGGGSLEDLWAFNDEQLARAIAASNTPVVSAVGHETDFSLTDFAADLRAPTPSVAAELLVPDQRDLTVRLRRLAQRLTQLQTHALGQAMQRADRAALRLQTHSPQARLNLLRHRQEAAFARLDAAWRQQQERRQARLANSAAILRATQPQWRVPAAA